jgi:hypothetical protein
MSVSDSISRSLRQDRPKRSPNLPRNIIREHAWRMGYEEGSSKRMVSVRFVGCILELMRASVFAIARMESGQERDELKAALIALDALRTSGPDYAAEFLEDIESR